MAEHQPHRLVSKPLQLHPEVSALLNEIALLRGELAHLFTEERDLLHIAKPHLLALYQQKIGAWELRRLHAEAETMRAKRRLALAQAAVNQGQKPDWTEIDGQLELEFLAWQQRLKEAAEKITAAEEHFKHLLPPADAHELRKLYYALVKKLHPDLNPELTCDQRRLWLRVQEAYECGDLGELRALALLVEQSAPVPPGPGPIDVLRCDRETLSKQIAAMLLHLEKIESVPPFTLRAQLADDAWVAARRQELDAEIAKLEAQRAAYEIALKPFTLLPNDGQKFGPN